jgi:hypothetical protein
MIGAIVPKTLVTCPARMYKVSLEVDMHKRDDRSYEDDEDGSDSEIVMSIVVGSGTCIFSYVGSGSSGVGHFKDGLLREGFDWGSVLEGE